MNYLCTLNDIRDEIAAAYFAGLAMTAPQIISERAIGLAFFIRGLLQRKTEKAQRQIQSSDQGNAGEDKKPT